MTVLARGARGARSEDVRRRKPVHPAPLRPRARADRRAAELTAVLGLNRSTIGDLTGELVGRRPGARGDRPGRGRPSYGEQRRPAVARRAARSRERVQVLAVDVGVTHLTVARVGLGGVVLARRDRSYRRGARRPARRDRDDREGRRRAARRDRAAAPSSSAPGSPCRAWCGAATGRCARRPNLGWQDAPVGHELAEALRAAGRRSATTPTSASGPSTSAARRPASTTPSTCPGTPASAPASSPAACRSAAGPATPARSATSSSTPAACRATAGRAAAGRPSAARSGCSSWPAGRPAAASPACARWWPPPRRATHGRPRRAGARRRLARPRHRQRGQRAQPGGRHPRRRPRGDPARPPATRCAPSSRPPRWPRRWSRCGIVDPAPRPRLDPGGRRRARLRRPAVRPAARAVPTYRLLTPDPDQPITTDDTTMSDRDPPPPTSSPSACGRSAGRPATRSATPPGRRSTRSRPCTGWPSWAPTASPSTTTT